jgi:DNA-directed RNA polymerase subunit beta
MQKKFFSRYKEPLVEIPNLIKDQLGSFNWVKEKGIKEIFEEFSPITDYQAKKFQLEFSDIELGQPKYDEYYAKDNKITYEAPLRVKVKLINKTTGSEKQQEIFMADFPMQTSHGTFIINGVERVMVPQLIRSFGVLFSLTELKGKKMFGAKIIPARGAWIEIETEATGNIVVRIDRKRKFSVTSLLRVLGATYDKDIYDLFSHNPHARGYIEASLQKDMAKNVDESYVEIYRKLRDGDLSTANTAKEFISTIFSEERYDLSKVGRFRFNNRFSMSTDDKELERKTISLDDVVKTVSHIITLNNTPGAKADDIDHLGSRRVRLVGEMLQQKLRVGLSQMKRNIQDRMSTAESDVTLPINFISPRPLQARIKEFYTTNQLSQFMSQDNILYEVEHLRQISALGPGGLTRERAGLEVRDVHPSHYGRVCPIHSPEGPNIGLILHLSTYARINDFGIIETPYAKVQGGKVTKEVVFLNALEEEDHRIAHAGNHYDEVSGEFETDIIEVRFQGKPGIMPKEEVDFIDTASNQAFSIATSMIPFLNHDDPTRALMGSNMQKQAVPCLKPKAPLVATGIEERTARDSGRLVYAGVSGEVSYVDSRKIEIKDQNNKKYEYPLVNFSRTNHFSFLHQRPVVDLGQKVKKGDLLADTSSSDNGQVAVGQNCLVAFMTWSGANYEDAIIISNKLVKEDIFTSVYVDEFEAVVRDTKLGPEVTTHDIPNVGESKLKNLDEDGIIRVGAEVRPGDILVGKITPKGETQLTPEERLLRSIFGEKARDVKDTSLRVEGGKRGRVVDAKIFSRDNGDTLESGIIKKIYIQVAQLREVSVGDKLAGRHGNKGVISRILPEEDMPYMKDGTPIDVILTPLGVPSRMNLGQILELHLGLAAKKLNYQAIVPPFAGATIDEIKGELKSAGVPENGKVRLYDGRTGIPFDQDIAIGYMYILKLHHMVDDKIHMRSIGPYSLITQQPLGGKAQAGGQRFGEMEVWALLGYGSSYTLREVLTIKSDDIRGRSAAFDSIVKGKKISQINLPASFHVLLSNLRGLGLDVSLNKEE